LLSQTIISTAKPSFIISRYVPCIIFTYYTDLPYHQHVVFSEAVFHPFAANHRFISFMLYVFGLSRPSTGIITIYAIPAGFMGFVASLKRKYLQRQFSLFGWVHMTLLVVVVSSHFIVDNILEVSSASLFPHTF
jgi:phosphatidate cytidylyltransferase